MEAVDDQLVDDIIASALAHDEVTRALADLVEATGTSAAETSGELREHVVARGSELRGSIDRALVIHYRNLVEIADWAWEKTPHWERVRVAQRHLESTRSSAQASLKETDIRVKDLQRRIRSAKMDRTHLRLLETLPSLGDPARAKSGARRRWVGWLRRSRSAVDAVDKQLAELTAELDVAERDHQSRVDEMNAQVARAQVHRLSVEEDVRKSAPDDVREAQQEADAARAHIVSSTVERSVLPVIRDWINDQRTAWRIGLYRMEFDSRDTEGIRQMVAPEHEVATSASTRLMELMELVGGGSIGVSGPRGVGKSTLIEAVCANREWVAREGEHTGLFIPAPAEYDPREFLLHLFAKLCRAVDPDGALARPDDVERDDRASLWLAVGVALLVGGLVFVAQAVGAQAIAAASTGLVVVGCVLLVAAWPPRRVVAAVERRSNAQPPTPANGLFRLSTGMGCVLGLIGGEIALFVKGPFTFAAAMPLVPVALCLVVGGAFARRRLAWFAHVGVAASVLTAFAAVVLSMAPPQVLLVEAALFGVASVVAVLARCLPEVPEQVPSRVVVAASSMAAGVAAAATWAITVPPGVLWGGLAVAAGFAILRAARRPAGRAVVLPVAGPSTRDYLERIEYQLTIAKGYTHTAKLGAIGASPLGVERARTGTTSKVRTPWTYPDIVADFRAYVDAAVAGGRALVIGIDELDKLEPDAAARFLNDIKAVFDTRTARCHYLISVSEEALAGFEQRGIVARDVFDTAFDEMFRVEPLTIAESVTVLGKRIIGVSHGVVGLCHVLSGGLPRDLVRMMRLAVSTRGPGATVGLSALASRMCEHESQARLRGLRTECAKLPDWRRAAAVVRWSSRLGVTDTAGVTDIPHELADAAVDDVALVLLLKHASAHYHLVTVAQFFTTVGTDMLERAETAPDGIAALAAARTEIGVNWVCAWETISAFRRRWIGDVLDVPSIGVSSGS